MSRVFIPELLREASGRWIAILTDVGVSEGLLDGRGHPCPKCGGRDRFATFPDVAERGAVHCRHCFTAGCDPKPGDGLATLRWILDCDTPTACRWLSDWLGMTSGSSSQQRRPYIVKSLRVERSRKPNDSMARLAELCHQAIQPDWLDRLAGRLNLKVESLVRLRVGWLAEQKATSWPMIDELGIVVGIRLRSIATNEKWSVRHGRDGLFVPSGLPDEIDRLFICEGPTDTAALLSLGFNAIGRASANGAGLLEAKLVQQLRPSECVIVGDNDQNLVGTSSAKKLAIPLLMCCKIVRIILPPGHNDIRDWVAAGATSADVNALVDSTKPRSLRLRSEGLQ